MIADVRKNAVPVMNTIPLIFNERQIKRTTLGGAVDKNGARMPVSALLLSRGGKHYRSKMLNVLVQCGFESIVTIETDPKSYNIENMAAQYPQVKFVVTLENLNVGEMINIGIEESSAEHVLVLWDDIKFSIGTLSANLASKLIELNHYCIVPRLITKLQGMPVVTSPSAQSSKFQVLRSSFVKDGEATLYPFDFVGLYDKEKFMTLGGFDYTIESAYWQNLDLAVRSWLWGEKTSISTAFQLIYDGSLPVEDQTANMSELRFYLKNLVPVHKYDHGVIPSSAFFRYMTHSSIGFFAAYKSFFDAKRWTEKNKYRFKTDIVSLMENWGGKEEK